MRQKPQLRWKRPLWPVNRPVWLLALGLALAPGALSFSAYAETFPLESVDFKTGAEQTQIVLHTGSIVPVNKISSTADKLVLEIDQVDTSETVKTNFGGATNITHIIMQPINEHKIRMIVRGEHLAPPTIAFFNPSNAESTAPTDATPALFQMKQSTSSVKPVLSRTGTPEMLSQPSSPLTSKPTANATAGNQSGSSDPEMMPFLDGEEAIPTTKADSRVALMPQPTSKKPVPITSLESALLKGSHGSENQASWIHELQSGHYNNFLLGAMLSLIALGVGGWMVFRILKLRNGDADLDEFLPERTDGKKSSFKVMAEAYRNKHQNQAILDFDADTPSQPNNKKAHAEDVIGLHRLNQMDILPEDDLQPTPATPARKPQPAAPKASSPTADVQKQTANIEQLLTMMQSLTAEKQAEPAKQAKPLAAPRQAIQQYVQNQAVKPQEKKTAEKPLKKPSFPQINSPEDARNTAFPTAAMKKDMQRAQALQKELIQQTQQQIAAIQKPNPVNRALAAQKSQPSAGLKKSPATNPSKTKPQSNPTMGNQSNASKDKNGPLVGNPQVLDFLRNVADLMEKDGKPQIANSIQKNIRPM